METTPAEVTASAEEGVAEDGSLTRSESIAALQPVLSGLAYSFTRPRVHARVVAAAGAPVDRPGLALLRVLADEPGPLRVGELAERLDVRHPHVTRQIRELEQQGLVRREAGCEDRRVHRVAPTRLGLQVVDRVAKALEANLAESLAGVDPEKIMAAVEVLSHLDAGPTWGAAEGENCRELARHKRRTGTLPAVD